MRILLVKPPVKYPIKNEDVGMPLGLFCLSSYIKHNNPGVEISIFDCRLEKLNGTEYLLEKEIEKSDVIATSACTSEFNSACRILRMAKLKGKTTVIGGFFPTCNPEITFNFGHVDYLVRGEGEVTFSELVDFFNGKSRLADIKGISYIRNSRIVHNPDRPPIEDLNVLPMPDYETYAKKYINFTEGSIYSSRGCSNNCLFCSIRQFWNGCNRARSVENTIKEIELLASMGFEHVNFKDETMNLNKKRTLDILERAKCNDVDFKIKLMPCDLPSGFLRKAVSCGVDCIQIGVESVVPVSIKEMRKRRLQNGALEEKMNEILALGCKLNPIYLFGWPGETEQTLSLAKDSILKWAINDNVIMYLSFTTPHPGTEFFFSSRNSMNILSMDLDRYTHTFPVAVPFSLGMKGLGKLISTYHETVEEGGISKLNPPIPFEHQVPLLYMEGQTWKSKSRQSVLNHHSRALEISL